MTKNEFVQSAQQVLQSLGLPKAQQNERSALSLLALLDLRPKKKWFQATNPLMGITPIMDWIAKHYDNEVRTKHTRDDTAADHAPIR